MIVELLAPAGSFESMQAAYSAGADAVYIGGNRFGARAFADNLDTESMKKAINYAHLRNKKLYLTVNTLLKDREMEELYSYLEPFYCEGLDAVIVQDPGVLSFIKDNFSDMDIHASTQMTITGKYGAKLLKDLGASRIVTSRELSLSEIKDIHENVDIEIESFVHGALCFCYSGQCLLSSILGGRSGNRGRCAQPCRLPYQLYEKDKRISPLDQPYLMSPKDMCTLNIIPDCIDSGIYSFKMEGRMKKPEYTAGITEIYRKYIDLYLEKGRDHFHIEEQDLNTLMDLYNRGGFSEGYYNQHNSKKMMSMARPNHWGTVAAKYNTKGKDKGWFAVEDLHKNDVLEYRNGAQIKEFVFHDTKKKNEKLSLDIPASQGNSSGIIYRTRNEQLLSTLKTNYIDHDSKLKINGKLILLSGKSAILELSYKQFKAHVEGELVQPAQKRPISLENVEKQIRKMGQSEFVLDHLDILLDDNVFFSLQGLNELRRKAVLSLHDRILCSYKRDSQVNLPIVNRTPLHSSKIADDLELSISVESKEQFHAALSFDEIDRIYLDSAYYESFDDLEKNVADDIRDCHRKHISCFFILPWIFRDEAGNYFLKNNHVIELLNQFDGVMIKNLEEYEFLKDAGFQKQIITDHNLYSWNRISEQFWKSIGVSCCTLPFELNQKELAERGCVENEMIVYGHIPLMVTAQCFQKNTLGCTKSKKLLQLLDRKNKIFYIKNYCTFCYNVIYNSTPLELAANQLQIQELGVSSVRISFTIEEQTVCSDIIRHYIDVFKHHRIRQDFFKDFTRGHFKRGVE